jgi:hypothetical protein
MKALVLIALTFGFNLSHGQPLRRLGTNIYDLSPAMAAGQASNSCYIEGKVLNVNNGKITMVRVISTQFYMVPAGNPIQMDSSSLLGYLAAERMSARPLSAGQVLAMSPQMRQYVETVQQTRNITLANYPKPSFAGQTLKTYAIPLGNLESCTAWDYGTPIYAVPPGVDRIIRVYPMGMSWESLRARATPSTEHKAADESSSIKEFQMASNGVPSAQFSIGLRYINGYGVETNRPLGLYWIYKASYQDLPAAKEFVRTHLQP